MRIKLKGDRKMIFWHMKQRLTNYVMQQKNYPIMFYLLAFNLKHEPNKQKYVYMWHVLVECTLWNCLSISGSQSCSENFHINPTDIRVTLKGTHAGE